MSEHYADYANTLFQYAEILIITQWATSSCSVLLMAVAQPGPGAGGLGLRAAGVRLRLGVSELGATWGCK